MKNDLVKVVSKGYTLTLTSWENDGDYYNTTTFITEDVNEIKFYYNFLNFLKNEGRCLTNCDDFNKTKLNLILEYFKSNVGSVIKEEDINDILIEIDPEDSILDYFYNIIEPLELHTSEYYICRVVDRFFVTYSPEDIYLEKITF